MPSAIKTKVDQDSVYCLESGRLKSFDDSWPHSDESLCSRNSMAKAGFYYTGAQDCVKCFVCQIKLNGWDPENDEPAIKHQENSGNCMFAKLGKEENDLTVEQWCDVLCSRAINKFHQTYDKFQQNLKNYEDK